MTTQLIARTSASDLIKQIVQHLKELTEAMDKARTGEISLLGCRKKLPVKWMKLQP